MNYSLNFVPSDWVLYGKKQKQNKKNQILLKVWLASIFAAEIVVSTKPQQISSFTCENIV